MKQPVLQKSESVPELSSPKKIETPMITVDLYESTPSLNSRTSFIEQERIEPIVKSTFEIKQTVDLGEIQTNVETIEEKYSFVSNFDRKSLNKIDTPTFTIGCRVLINTGHTIINKQGIIRYIGEITVQKGLFYGIELDEPVGKNDGSLKDHRYFQCKTNHGTFVLGDKIQLIN